MTDPRLKPQQKPKLKPVLLPLLAFSLLWCTLPAIANGQTKANGQTTKPTASKTYDAKGKLIQKTDDKGRHYNTKGKFTGKTVTAPSGSKSYDAKGKLLQKTDERGRIYDAKGKYQGKVKPVSPKKKRKTRRHRQVS